MEIHILAIGAVVREFWTNILFKCRILFKIENRYLRLLSVTVNYISLLYVFITNCECFQQT